jgi:tetratricopeptide (TPR) repeat protein
MTRRQSRKHQRVELIVHREAYALLQQGRAHLKNHNFREAEESYLKVLAIEPMNPRALQGLAEVHFSNGENQLVIERLEAFLVVSPPTEYVLYILGNAYRALHKDRPSEKCYQRVLDLNPSNTRAMTRLADLHLKRGEFNETIDLCRRVLELEPHNIYALQNLANAYRGLKNYDQALAIFKNLVEQHPQDFRALSRMGDICLKLGKPREAERFYRESLKHKPGYSYSLQGLQSLASR